MASFLLISLILTLLIWVFSADPLPESYTEKYREIDRETDRLAEFLNQPWQPRIKRKLKESFEEFYPLMTRYLTKLEELIQLQDELGAHLKGDKSFLRSLKDKVSGMDAMLIQEYLCKLSEVENLTKRLVELFQKPWEAHPYRPQRRTQGPQRKQETQSQSQTHDRTDEILKGNAESNPHEILDIDEEARTAEILSAYRGLMMRYHPDRLQEFPTDFRLRAQEVTIQIIRAKKSIDRKRNAS